MSVVPACERCAEGKFVWFINREFLTPELRRRLADPDALMKHPAVPIARRDGLPRVTGLVRTRLPELPGKGLIIKRYAPRSRWSTFKDIVRPSRARRAFQCAFSLRERGIVTPIPVAVGERRCCRWLREAVLISEEIPEAQTAFEWREHSRGRFAKHRLARGLARTLARLHNAGFTHSDPNFSNFLVRPAVDPSRELVVIDWDGIRSRGFVSLQAAASDLYRLVRYMEPSERLWFSAQYSRSRNPRLDAREFDRTCSRYIRPRKPSAAHSSSVVTAASRVLS